MPNKKYFVFYFMLDNNFGFNNIDDSILDKLDKNINMYNIANKLKKRIKN
jgi:hypothetical protein